MTLLEFVCSGYQINILSYIVKVQIVCSSVYLWLYSSSTKGSSKKEGTTQTTQTSRAGRASLKTGIYEPLALDNYVYPPY